MRSAGIKSEEEKISLPFFQSMGKGRHQTQRYAHILFTLLPLHHRGIIQLDDENLFHIRSFHASRRQEPNLDGRWAYNLPWMSDANNQHHILHVFTSINCYDGTFVLTITLQDSLRPFAEMFVWSWHSPILFICYSRIACEEMGEEFNLHIQFQCLVLSHPSMYKHPFSSSDSLVASNVYRLPKHSVAQSDM